MNELSPDHDAPQGRPSAPPGPRRHWKWLPRLGPRGFLIFLVCLLGGLGLLAWFYPWSSPWLDRKISARVETATGLHLQYRKATFRLSRGTVVMRDPVILDPQTSRPLVQAETIRIEMPLAQLWRDRPPYTVNRIRFHGPFVVDVISHEGGGLTLGRRWSRVVQLVRERLEERRQEARRGAPRVVLDRIDISPVSVRWRLQDEQGRRQTLAQLNSAALNLDFGGSLQLEQLRVNGELAGATARDLRLEVNPDQGYRSASFSFWLDRFDSSEDLPWALPVDFEAQGWRISGAVHRDGVNWMTSGNAQVRQVEFAGALPAQQAAKPATLAWDLTWRGAEGRLDLRRMSLKSSICTLESSGTLVTRPPFSYDLRLSPLSLPGPGVNVLASALDPGGRITQPGEAAAWFAGALHGRLTDKRPQAVIGRARVNGLSLSLRNFPALANIQVQAQLSTRTLSIVDSRALVEGIPVQLSGQILGRFLTGEIEAASLSWKSRGELGDLARIVNERTQGRLKPLTLSGRVESEGTIRAPEPLEGELDSVLERARIEGIARFSGVSADHEALPGPLRDLKGQLAFSSKALRLQECSGRILNTPFELTGQIAGQPLFWQKPTLELRGQASAQLERLIQDLKQSRGTLRQRLARLPPMRGQARLELGLSGRSGAWREAQYDGTLALTDFTTDLMLEGIVNGPLALKAMELSFTPRAAELSNVSGRLGGLSLSLNADLKPGGATADLVIAGALREIQQRIPAALKRFRVDGQGRVESSLRTVAVRGFQSPATWLDWRQRPLAVGESWREWFARRWRLNTNGEIQLKDAELTWQTMPTRLRAISGSLRFDSRRLWTPQPVPMRAGESARETRGLVELIYGADVSEFLRGGVTATPKLTFTVSGGHVGIDEWLGPWQAPVPPGGRAPVPRKLHPLEYNPKATPTFRLRGDVQTNSASWRGAVGQDFRAKIELDTYEQYSNRLAWTATAGRLYEGGLAAEGAVVRQEMNMTASLESVRLRPLVQALSAKRDVSGIFSGVLNATVKLHRGRGTPAPPLQGSGQLRIQDSRFVSNKILLGLGGLLKLPFFRDITFSSIHGPFQIDGEQYRTRGLVFDAPLVNLNIVGSYGPENALDLDVQLHFLQVVGKVPLVGSVLKIFNKYAGKVLGARVRGTTEAPSVSLL